MGARALLALACACAASLTSMGCNADRSQGATVTSIRVEPERRRAPGPSSPSATVVEALAIRKPSAPSSSTRRSHADSTSPSASAAPPGDVRPSPASEAHQLAAESERPLTERGAAPSASDPLAAPSAQLEPGFNEEFDEDLLLDLDEALAAVDENAFAMLFKKVQVLVDGELVKKEKFAHPDNCRRWRGLRSKGYAPKSALGKQIDAGALVRCGSLEFLAKAHPSRRSHVRNLLVGAGPSSLPAIVASAPSPLAQQARERAIARSASLAEFLPSAHTVPSELPGRLSIAEPSSESSIILNAEAWGDINRDGIEDLVLSVLNTADDGTDYDMRLIEVTRLSPSSPLSVLSVQE